MEPTNNEKPKKKQSRGFGRLFNEDYKYQKQPQKSQSKFTINRSNNNSNNTNYNNSDFSQKVQQESINYLKNNPDKVVKVGKYGYNKYKNTDEEQKKKFEKATKNLFGL